ncbi:hypothetical protein EJB05_02464, partial [Eragrostis curvula]
MRGPTASGWTVPRVTTYPETPEVPTLSRIPVATVTNRNRWSHGVHHLAIQPTASSRALIIQTSARSPRPTGVEFRNRIQIESRPARQRSGTPSRASLERSAINHLSTIVHLLDIRRYSL